MPLGTLETEPRSIVRTSSERTIVDEALDALVRRAQAGDEVAFERLVERVHPSIYRWALGFTLDPDEADDIAQEVCIRVYRFLGGFSGESEFATWLFRITHNVAMNNRKRSAKHIGIGERLTQAFTANPVHVESPECEFRNSEVIGLVRNFATKLPETQRVIFDLADLQGYAPTEIAKMMNMKAVTVRTSLHKARVALRSWLLERDPEIQRGGAS